MGRTSSASDVDYAICSGLLTAPFDTHFAQNCTTLGATSAIFSPSVDDAYYRVVPLGVGGGEGPYGLDSELQPRVAASPPCALQQVAGCAAS